MRLALAYVHMRQSYLGGLLKRAAQRLSIDVVSIGPAEGDWIDGPPPEQGWEPDVRCADRTPVTLPVEADALINIDQGDGFYCTAPRGLPTAHLFTEGNEGEYQRTVPSGAVALWSLQPFKPAGRAYPGVNWLEWGYDPVQTPIAPVAHERPLDFLLLGSMGYPHRQRLADALPRTADLTVRVGPPVARDAWGALMRESRTTLQDHGAPALPGRIIDAVVSGCLVLSIRNWVMDVLIPRGYVEIPSVEPDVVAAAVREWRTLDRRAPIAERAYRLVAGSTWDSRLLKVLGSINVRP